MSDEENSSKSELWVALRQLPFLRGVDDQHVGELAKLAMFVEFPEGTIIFRECEPAEKCYLIVEGNVVLEICGSAVGCTQIQTVGDGELLGWSAVLGGRELTSTARTLTATRAIQLSGPQILSLCERDAAFGYQVFRATALTLAKRLTATRLQLIDLFREEMPTGE